MAATYTAERTLSAVFKEQSDVDQAIRRLIERNVPRDHIIERYNAVLDETGDEMRAEQAAWVVIHEQYDEDDNGVWSREKVTA